MEAAQGQKKNTLHADVAYNEQGGAEGVIIQGADAEPGSIKAVYRLLEDLHSKAYSKKILAYQKRSLWIHLPSLNPKPQKQGHISLSLIHI